MLEAFWPIIEGKIEGKTMEAILHGLTLEQWRALGDALLSATANEVALVSKLHPAVRSAPRPPIADNPPSAAALGSSH